MSIAWREAWTGRFLLILMMAVTLLPFLSLFVTALHPSRTYPAGLAWPDDPQWGNFVRAFEAANMGELLKSSGLIVLGVVPISILLGTMVGFAIGHLRVIGGRVIFLLFVLGLTLPFEGIITPLYYQIRDMGLLNTRWAIILPLIGLFMPFSVFWMRAHFVNMPGEMSESARMDGATTWQLFRRIHVPPWPCRRSRPWASCCSCGPGTSSCWPSSWSTTLPNGRWPSALGAFQGQWGTDIPLLCAGSLLILTPHAGDLPHLPASLRQGPAAGLVERMTAMSAPPLYGGIEAGGTKWVCAIADADGKVLATRVIPTTTPETTITAAVRFFREHRTLAAVGVGSFGPVDLRTGSPTYGHITATPKPGWSGTDVVSPLRAALRVPVGLDTDVNAAALGEWRRGAGRGLGTVAYMTVGTGIGVGAVVNG
ncbi:ROK family protein [Nonomuraea ferruginea]